MALAATIIALAAIGLGVLAWRDTSAPQLPRGMIERANFHIYYPQSPPATLHIDRTSADYSQGIAVYTLVSKDVSQYITISQQRAPRGVNAESILRIPDREPTPLSIGTLYDRSANGKQSYAIITNDNVIIYVNPSNAMDSSLVQQVLTTLR